MLLVLNKLSAGVRSVFHREPISECSRSIAFEVQKIGVVAHEDRFIGREEAFRRAIREGVIEPAGGAWSYDTDGLYTLTGRGQRIVRTAGLALRGR